MIIFIINKFIFTIIRHIDGERLSKKFYEKFNSSYRSVNI